MSVQPSESAMTALLQPVLLPGERIEWVAYGHSAPLEVHDGLTMAIRRWLGRWRPEAVILALTPQRLLWATLTPGGDLGRTTGHRLPLKGRWILQGPGVLERQFPGEPRRFVTFADTPKAADLYRRIDDQQKAVQRAHGPVAEVVGVGVRPVRSGEVAPLGPHGETAVLQHDDVDGIRPSYRPPR